MSRTVIVFQDAAGRAYQSIHLTGRNGVDLFVAGRRWSGFTREEVATEIQLARVSGARISRRVEVLS